MKYNNEKYARLKNGSIEQLYYDLEDVCEQYNDNSRMFYEEEGKWYLDHEKITQHSIVMYHDEIVEFLNNKD